MLRCGIDAEPATIPDTLPNGTIDTTQNRSRLEAARQSMRARCLAEEDSVIRGLRKNKADIDSGFVIFGLDFFRDRTTQFNPNQAGPVDASYVIHPGDELVLVLTGDVEQSYTLFPVTREGFIVIPQVGQVWVNNLTMAELENVLYQRLGRVYSGVRRGPGRDHSFLHHSGATGQQPDLRHGGRSEARQLQNLQRGNRAHRALCRPRPLRERKHEASPDTARWNCRRHARRVRLPAQRKHCSRREAVERGSRFRSNSWTEVRIVGQVARPATYEMRPNETLADALRFAGGFTATAARQRVQIERIVPPAQRTPGGRDRIVTEIVSDQFTNGVGPSVAVLAR